VETVSDSEQELGPLLKLPAVLDLKAAGPLAAAFLARRGADITVDAGEVQRLGGQCLQVLLAAQLSWREDMNSMHIQAPSADFLSALELFGVTREHLFQEEDVV
jgi:chemotaxis protein CheX